jgi:hypothetical protein
MAVLEHVLDSEVFDGDEGVGVHVLPSRLVHVVLALAGDLEVLLGGLLGSFSAAVGLLKRGKPAFCPSSPRRKKRLRALSRRSASACTVF